MAKRGKTNYRVTIGYKAVISVVVNAEQEDQAKQMALQQFKSRREKMFTGDVILEDDSYGAYGVVDQDKTWNTL